MPRFRFFVLFLFACLLGRGVVAAAEGCAVTLEDNDNGVAVMVDGELFTQYVVRSSNRPILWPINGPTGEPMTRAWPMGPAEEGEHLDHVHQRSFWFTHEGVSGVNFWAEPKSYSPKKRLEHKVGFIAHRAVTEKKNDADGATLVTVCDWLDPLFQKILEQRTVYRFSATEDCRTVDLTVTLTATDGDVEFEDRKDGMFGIRTANSMRIDAKLGGKTVNSEGLVNSAAWGHYASWIDNTGPVAGETVGVAILWHPSNFRNPIRWHIRGYGLLAANPFAEEGFPESDRKQGPLTVKQGESLTVRIRTLFHRGDTEQAKIAEAYAKYAKE